MTRATIAAVLGGCLYMTHPGPARAELTPKSERVQKLVAQGVKFLETATDGRPGAHALFGLTMLKAEVKPDNPMVQKGLASIREAASSKARLESLDVYSVALGIIFLIELDPAVHKAEIKTLFDHLLSIQKPHGGWGYRERLTGDTSMTQYCVLALWELEHSGFPAPPEVWDKVGGWLMRTQDPTGCWGYQGNDPGSYTLVQQTETRHSMASAGLGSLYICADHYQYRRAQFDPSAGVPVALQRVRKPAAPAAPRVVSTRLDLNRMGQALDLGDAWMRENYTINPVQNAHYYLYAFERYQSFRELASSSPFQPSTWYDDGVYQLEKTISSSGSWQGSWGAEVDTSFALLFLLRSSRKSIERVHHLGPGTLVTGRGLPSGNDIEMRMGQVRQKPLSGPAETLLSAIEDPSHPDYLRAVEGLEDKVERAAPAELSKLTARLRAVAGGDSPAARVAALSALGKTRDLDNAPLILAALSDPDDDVFLAAEDALKFMSRTFDNPAENDSLTPARRAAAQRKWRNWLLSVRPNAKLDE